MVARPNLTAVGFDDAAADREADAHTRGGVLGFFRAVEGSEDLLGLALAEAHTVIPDRHFHLSRIVQLEPHFYGGVRRTVLVGVAKEVLNNLGDKSLLPEDRR